MTPDQIRQDYSNKDQGEFYLEIVKFVYNFFPRKITNLRYNFTFSDYKRAFYLIEFN